MSDSLKLGTINCPHDKTPLHFEVWGTMRVRRNKGAGHIYQALCPVCGGNFQVHAPKEIDMSEPKKKSRKSAQLAQAFAAAKVYLSDTCMDQYGEHGVWRHEFICHCIDRARMHGDISEVLAERAADVIKTRLSGFNTLQAWVRHNNPELENAVPRDRASNEGRRMQATRLAWLNSLIKEFGR